MNAERPLLLMILDGWGHREAAPDNAIACAQTPHWDRLWANHPTSLINTSGEAVGLPAGQMGNSEVGHMNIGAGRIVYQDYTRISHAIETGEFRDNPSLNAAINASAGASCHIMGLLSDGGVHSHEDHLHAMVRLAHERGAKRIWVHAILDGRDTPPRSAREHIEKLETLLETIPGGAIATLSGRYWAMDRDQRWERVQKAWQAIANGQSEQRFDSAMTALESSYANDISDEFVEPVIFEDYSGMATGDSLVFVNFRADRAREITRAFVDQPFTGFEQPSRPELSQFVCMTEYADDISAPVAFPPVTLTELFGEVIAREGLKQLRIAETEKYAHVTFFFNGGDEAPYPGEERILIPSPKVATYDLQPEMSAPELTEKLCAAIEKDYDVIICNVANPDMVGHSGKMDAAIAACEAVDRCLGAVDAQLRSVGGEMLITADHGNVEQMADSHSGQAHTAHTTNPVPLVYTGSRGQLQPAGTLRDLAPTMLELLGIPQPDEMTGQSLLIPAAPTTADSG